MNLNVLPRRSLVIYLSRAPSYRHTRCVILPYIHFACTLYLTKYRDSAFALIYSCSANRAYISKYKLNKLRPMFREKEIIFSRSLRKKKERERERHRAQKSRMVPARAGVWQTSRRRSLEERPVSLNLLRNPARRRALGRELSINTRTQPRAWFLALTRSRGEIDISA